MDEAVTGASASLRSAAMGYSHYWGRRAELDQDVFVAFSDEVRRLIRAVRPRFGFFGGVKIRGSVGWGPPHITTESVNFNGRPYCETFWIARRFADQRPDAEPDESGLLWNFTKTNGLPYDVVVTASLLSFKHHFPEARLGSDGGRPDWQPGIDLFEQVTGRSAPASPFEE